MVNLDINPRCSIYDEAFRYSFYIKTYAPLLYFRRSSIEVVSSELSELVLNFLESE